jgi:hypothetical protein
LWGAGLLALGLLILKLLSLRLQIGDLLLVLLDRVLNLGILRVTLPKAGVRCRSYEGCSSEEGLRSWGCEAPTLSPEFPG